MTEVNELAETLDKIIHRTTVRYFKKPVERKPQAQAQAHAQNLEVPPVRGDMITSPSYQSPDNLSAVKPSTIDQHQSSNSRRSSIHDRPADMPAKPARSNIYDKCRFASQRRSQIQSKSIVYAIEPNETV